jgi:hypothetical protein
MIEAATSTASPLLVGGALASSIASRSGILCLHFMISATVLFLFTKCCYILNSKLYLLASYSYLLRGCGFLSNALSCSSLALIAASFFDLIS